jgi:hypothetical protein
MKRVWAPNRICALVSFLLLCVVVSAEEPGCREISAMARVAHAKSAKAVVEEKQKAGDSYRAQVVFAARSFELHPMDKRAAVSLLSLIPQDDTQHTAWMTMGDSLCAVESVDEIKLLGALGERLPHDLAQAVLLDPDKLPDYVAYAATSVRDPHSDYAVQMQAVCRSKHSDFVKAVRGLPADQRDWFVKHIFNPDGCHALAQPEAE